jgi:prepilin-type N-terminal cleavage/methylation domain-containing protein
MIKKGFTLIELLVVIAIIGLLASIVFVSLSAARSKAKDTAIKSNLANLRSAAELYASNNITNTFVAFCTTATPSADWTKISSGITSNGSTAYCNDALGSWIACAQLKEVTANAYCVDYQGRSKILTGVTCNAAYVVANTFCP